MEGKASRQTLEEKAADDFSKDLAILLDGLAEAGYTGECGRVWALHVGSAAFADRHVPSCKR
jgi:hypothetical protein